MESKIWHKWTYLWNRNRITNIENRPVVAKGEGVGGGMEWEAGVSRCKLLYTGCIHNKVLLYSTGNYIQYPMIGTSLVVQWLRIRLPMWGTRVRSLLRELRSHMPWGKWACVLHLLSPHTTTTEPTRSGAHEPQLERSPRNATKRPHATTKTRHSQK